MPWHIEIIEEPKAVSASLEGPMRLIMVKEAAAAAIRTAAEHHLDKYYTDERKLQPELSTLEIHGLPDALGAMGLGKRDKVAIVYTASSPRAMDFRFFETTALNRGYSVKLFTDPEKALRWLRGG